MVPVLHAGTPRWMRVEVGGAAVQGRFSCSLVGSRVASGRSWGLVRRGAGMRHVLRSYPKPRNETWVALAGAGI